MSFNPDEFLSGTVAGEMSTEFTPIPEGEYNAVIDKVEARSTRNGGAILDVTWIIDDQAVREATGLENPKCRQSVFLDITASGGIDVSKGKNIGLGRLREAVGQNGPQAWAPGQLVGNVARVKVEHRLYEGNTFADVKRVSKL